jgi:formylglycine-generating enzyme required for sulfatase activity
MTMVLIPAGTFQMGAVPADDQAEADEKPRHAVTLSKAYYLDEHEVTNEQFGRFVAATRHVTRAEAVGNGFVTDDSGACDLVEGASWAAPLPKGRRPMDWARHPVVLVAWEDATAYARWAGASLPTEAQFERALRGGAEGRKYPWGDGLPAPRGSGNYADATAERRFSGWTWTMEGYDDGHERTAPVKSFAANGYGAYDLSGNVWEWCSDWYAVDIYGQSPARDPAGPASGSSRVARGGSWFNVGPGNLRASHRDDYGPSIRSDVLGFRCSRSLP